MKNMLFLNIDGVLCSYMTMNRKDIDGKGIFKYSAVQALNKIIDHYDYHLCLLSKWNAQFTSPEEMAEFLRTRGVAVQSLIRGDQYNKSRYVVNYISDNPCSNYLIIDDEPQEYMAQAFVNSTLSNKRIIAPNRYRCLDEYDTMHIFDLHLNE